MFSRIANRLARIGANFAPVRGWLVRYYEARGHVEWGKPHPIDAEYGIDTAGFVPGYVLETGGKTRDVTAYGGSQPSVVRYALGLIGDPGGRTFLDVGCGKGRVLAIASELPFRRIVGIEISPEIAKIAERNVALVRRRFPGRPPISVVAGDALDYTLPDGPLAIFLYHPFGEETMRRFVRHLESGIDASGQPMIVAFSNPVHAEWLDASPHFVRTHAARVPYGSAELGCGPDDSDVVLVWEHRRDGAASITASAALELRTVKPGWRIELAPARPEGLSDAAG